MKWVPWILAHAAWLLASLQIAAAQSDAQLEPDEKSPQTAEDILRELQKQRPTHEVIPPASWAGNQAPVEAPELLPEGTTLVGLAGHVERVGDWWDFVLDERPAQERDGFVPSADRVKLLPNSTLEALVRMTLGAEGRMGFELSGELTVYREENYLLARSAMRGTRAQGRPEGAATSEKPLLNASAKPSSPAEAVAADAPVEDVLEKMKQLTPSRTTMPVGAPRAEDNDDQLTSASAPIFEGTPVIRRTGRIVPQGEWWAFAFDTDQADSADQPLRLLPNQSLHFMVDIYERNPAGLVFTISGEVTEFSGRNYLLVRSVTRRLDLGNLRR